MGRAKSSRGCAEFQKVRGEWSPWRRCINRHFYKAIITQHQSIVLKPVTATASLFLSSQLEQSHRHQFLISAAQGFDASRFVFIYVTRYQTTKTSSKQCSGCTGTVATFMTVLSSQRSLHILDSPMRKSDLLCRSRTTLLEPPRALPRVCTSSPAFSKH